MEQSSRKRWREEISSVQFSGTPYGEFGHYRLQHTLTQPRKKRGEGVTSPQPSARAACKPDRHIQHFLVTIRAEIDCIMMRDALRIHVRIRVHVHVRTRTL